MLRYSEQTDFFHHSFQGYFNLFKQIGWHSIWLSQEWRQHLDKIAGIVALSYFPLLKLHLWFMVFNATFNNISVILWQSVLLVKETRENHLPVTSHWQIYHIMLYRAHLACVRFELTTLVVIGTDCIASF